MQDALGMLTAFPKGDFADRYYLEAASSSVATAISVLPFACCSSASQCIWPLSGDKSQQGWQGSGSMMAAEVLAGMTRQCATMCACAMNLEP